MRQTEEKKEKRRKVIIKTARKVFAKHGYFLTTVDMIAKTAGLAKGTIYLYFKNKEDLFFSLLEEGYVEFHKYLIEIKEQPIDPLKKILEIIKLEVDFHQKHTDICRLFFNNQGPDIENILPKFREKILKKHELQANIIAEIIREGIEKGLLKKADTHKTAITIMGTTHSLLMSNVLGICKSHRNKKDDISFLYNFILTGCQK
ncbi:MAG: TetR/AcrR family transcriptional regulator [bacterium]|nr:TetR/AcrR family transcriptional regulator [bacterium]